MNRGSPKENLAGPLKPYPASMRPRFMNRGSNSLKGHHLLHVIASMRPRFMNRGSALAKVWKLSNLDELQ